MYAAVVVTPLPDRCDARKGRIISTLCAEDKEWEMRAASSSGRFTLPEASYQIFPPGKSFIPIARSARYLLLKGHRQSLGRFV